ncbi:hypothetical protein CASFOL_021287 [Castilleja foliolosa]|uniref:HVA22-like protein n=1 Tax=Castilleja foliolosa TaxID=1961234 RepID=A0ABD3CX02_9LAMI
MIGSILARPLLMVFGYVYPAYECYKFVERRDLEMDQLKIWCQYWIIVALLTTCERVGDNVLCWLPLYDEVKVALVLYIWHPKIRGSRHIYGSFLKPYMVKHEMDIDLYVVKVRDTAALITTWLWQKILSYYSKEM